MKADHIIVKRRDWEAKDAEIERLNKQLKELNVKCTFELRISEGNQNARYFRWVHIYLDEYKNDIVRGSLFNTCKYIGERIARNIENELKTTNLIDRLITQRISDLSPIPKPKFDGLESEKEKKLRESENRRRALEREKSVLWKLKDKLFPKK